MICSQNFKFAVDLYLAEKTRTQLQRSWVLVFWFGSPLCESLPACPACPVRQAGQTGQATRQGTAIKEYQGYLSANRQAGNSRLSESGRYNKPVINKKLPK